MITDAQSYDSNFASQQVEPRGFIIINLNDKARTKPIYDHRRDERIKGKPEGSTRLGIIRWSFLFIYYYCKRKSDSIDRCVFIFRRIKKGEDQGKEGVTLKL